MFSWYDFPAILRHRSQVVCLNKALFLTRGNPVGFASLLARLNHSSTSCTAVQEPSEVSKAFFSQILHQPGNRSARFSFFLPDFSYEKPNISALVDFLSYQAGEMGALNILAEVEESHPLFELFQRAGFSVFSWEAVWRLPDNAGGEPGQSGWRKTSVADENTVRCLYQTLVPPLVQNAEPFSNGGTPRLIYKPHGEAVAYVESISGREGIYLVPVIHPSVEDVVTLLRDLVSEFQGAGKPLYLQVRSYQAWLSDALQTIQGQPSSRCALLVKHLAVAQRNSVKVAQRSRVENRQVEPTAPILQNFKDAARLQK